MWSDSVRFVDNKACSQQFAQHIESQKTMNEDRFLKKSMSSSSPLYRSTINELVDQDNVVLITEELEVFVLF